MEHYRNKKLLKRAVKAILKLKEKETPMYSGDLEDTLRIVGEAYEELAITSVMRDNDYLERLKTSFQNTPGQRALLVRGAAHTSLFVDLKRNVPEIEVTRDFLGKRNYDYLLSDAIIRKMVFQREEILPESPISELEQVQGLFSSMIASIGQDTLKIDTFDIRTINQIAKRMDSTELMSKLFDDVKQAKITELKKKQRKNTFNYFLARWILTQGLATPTELAKALGAEVAGEFIALLGDDAVSIQKMAERILDKLVKEKILSNKNVELLKTTNIREIEGEASSPLGGIDFNPNNVNFTEQGDKIQINFSATNIQNLNPESINGILPVIINISPLPSVLPLLGLEPQRNEEFEVFSTILTDPSKITLNDILKNKPIGS